MKDMLFLSEMAVIESYNNGVGWINMKLQPNKKYTTIAIYAFLVIAAAIALFYLINEHATVGRVIGTFVSLMMPFIYGAALAYILNPVLNWLEKKVFPRLFG